MSEGNKPALTGFAWLSYFQIQKLKRATIPNEEQIHYLHWNLNKHLIICQSLWWTNNFKSLWIARHYLSWDKQKLFKFKMPYYIALFSRLNTQTFTEFTQMCTVGQKNPSFIQQYVRGFFSQTSQHKNSPFSL